MNLPRTFLSGIAILLLLLAGANALNVSIPGTWWHTPRIAAALWVILFVAAALCMRAATAFSTQTHLFKTRDPLTNLFNEKAFWDFLSHELARAKRHRYRSSLMILDLDNFKIISEMYGHEAADRCMCQFANLFKSSIRSGDIAARYSGDKFAAILSICDIDESSIVVKRFLDNLRSHPFVFPDGSTIQLTASIGLAVYPDHAPGEESLFLVAHSMMEQAKLSGKDQVKFPNDEVNIGNLRSAAESYILIMDSIQKKKIIPYFQPIVSTNIGCQVLAYEVLTRIVTPDKIMPAADFIETAEGIGAIGKIDYQLMEQALEAMKTAGYDGMLFFNLSLKALTITDFMPTILRILYRYGIRPDQIVFEITERETVKNLDLIVQKMAELRQEGFKFAIDDFGKGYSSFEYLKLFNVDFLKIDGDFIRNMNSASGIEKILVKSIVDVSIHLRIKTIAEFVESEIILDSVKSARIDYAQGFHIGRPAPYIPATRAVMPNEPRYLPLSEEDTPVSAWNSPQ